MLSGGADSAASTANPSKFAIKRTETEPAFEKLKIRDAKLALTDGKTLSVSWDVDETTTPPFAYDVKLFDNEAARGEPLATAANNEPHARSVTVDVSSLKLSGSRYYVRLQGKDILDRKTEVTMLQLPPTSN